MIKVMVADDNVDLNNSCCNYLSKDKDIEIVCSTFDGLETLHKYQEIRPDVLLLDLNLPSMNGLDIINNLNLDTEEIKLCNIIIISGDCSLRYNLLNTSKIFRIMPKPIEFKDILTTIKKIPIKKSANKNKICDENIRDFLFSLNCQIFSYGADFLVDAILIAYENPHLLRNMNDIYIIISDKYSIPYKKIKWGIRNSIDTINKNTSSEELNLKLKVPYCRKLTPKYFIPLAISHFDKKNETNL